MTKQEEIAELAEKAKELTVNLEALRQQVGHYSEAKVELQTTRKELGALIEQTQTLAAQTHQVLTHLNEIGAGKIFERLDQIESRQKRILYIGLGVAVLGFVLLFLRTGLAR